MDKEQDPELILLRDALETTGIGVWTFDLADQTLTWSDAVYRLYELSRNPVPPTLAFAFSFFSTQSRAQIEAALRRAISQALPWDLELHLLTARGRTISVRSRGRPVLRDGVCTRLMGTLEHAAASRPATDTQAIGEPDVHKLALIAQHTHDLVMMTDAQDRIEWVNQRFTEVTGYTLADARGKTPRELLGQSSAGPSSATEVSSSRKASGSAHPGVELQLYTRTGSPYWADVDVLPVFDASGQIQQFIHVQRDVTARKEAEAQKALLIERFDALTSGAGIGYAERDLESGMGYWDAQCFALHGLVQEVHAPSPESLQALVVSEDQDRYRQSCEQLVTQGTPIDVEYRIHKPDGSVAWIHLRAWTERDITAHPVRTIGMYMDVTGRKQADKQLQLTRARLELASGGSGMGLFEYNVDTGDVYWNDACLSLFGVSPAPHMPTWDAMVRRVHPEDRQLFVQHWDALKHSSQFQDVEFRVMRTDHDAKLHEHWLLMRGRLGPADGAQAGLAVGVMIDITDLRKTQHTLQGARDRLTLAAQASRIATWERDLFTGIGQWDPLMFRMHGLPQGDQAPAVQTVIGLVHPDDVARFSHAVQQLRTNHEAIEWEYRVIHPDGQMQHLLTRAQTQYSAEGTALRVVGATLDVSDSRRTAEQLREALSRLRIATEAAGVGTFERELATGSGRWDTAMARLWGFAPTEPTPTFERVLSMIVPEDRASVSAAMEHTTTVDQSVEFEYRIRRGDGKLAVLNTRGRVERNEEGTPIRIIGATVDVTASRETQLRLREFNEWMQLSSQATGVGFFRLSTAGEPLFADRQMRVHFGLEPEGPALSAADIRRNVLVEDQPLLHTAHQQALTGDGPVEAEYRVHDPRTGAIRYLFTRRVRVDAPDERGTSIVGAVLDVTASRAAQRALATTSERLALATRTAGVGIWEWDLASGDEVWDARMYEIYGITDPQWTPSFENWRALVHPDDRERAARPFGLSRDGLGSGETEYRIVRPHGEVRSVLGSYVVERNSAGVPVRMLGTDLDITEARRAQSERDTLSRRLDLMASEVGIGIWDWDIARNTTVWNEQMYALFGRTREQFAQHNWLDFVHEEDRERAQTDVQKALQEGPLLQSRFRVIWPDGSLRWIASRARIERTANGAPSRMVGANWDVTDLFRADQERQQLSERINIAAGLSGIGFWHFVIGSKFPYVDDQTIALYGRTREQDPHFAEHWLEYVHEDDYPRVKAAAERLTHTDEPVEIEFRIVLPDARIRHLAVRARRSIGPDGRGAVVNGVNWDVTEQRMAESTLRAKETAERANAAKTEFLSRMSHELRTPLNAVLGFAQIMEIDSRHPLEETQQGRLVHIQKAGWHLLTLINEILDLSRIEAGKTQLTMTAVPVGEVVDECLSLVSTQAEQRHITLHNEIDVHNAACAWADRMRFKQVVLNLLSNAVKYNRERGSVHVHAHTDEKHQVVVGIRDTGPGLTEAQMDEIFEPFNRLGLDTASNEGTGIGLTISLKLTQQMGGTLTVSSTAGVGSEFRITLQASAAPPALTSEQRSSTQHIRADIIGSVLYVEDNPANVSIIEDAMTLRPGVKLFTARDGAAARVLAAVCQPDLALLDLRLPDTDGVTLIGELQTAEATRHVPCVAVSANAAPADIASARRAGFVDFWPKPISIEQLLTGIDYWLTRQRLPMQ